jgi:hypothetical protein
MADLKDVVLEHVEEKRARYSRNCRQTWARSSLPWATSSPVAVRAACRRLKRQSGSSRTGSTGSPGCNAARSAKTSRR